METVYCIKFVKSGEYLRALYKSSYSTHSSVDGAMKFKSYQVARTFADYIQDYELDGVQPAIYKIETEITEAMEHEEVL